MTLLLERANLVVATRVDPLSRLQALVGKKLRGPFAGKTTFPGGKLVWDGENYEDRIVGAQREFMEETGLLVPIGDLRQAGRIRLYGDRFGLMDIFHTQLPSDAEPTSNDEMQL